MSKFKPKYPYQFLMNPYRFGGGTPPPAPQGTVQPLDLAFSQTNEINWVEMLPSNLVEMTEPFTADTGQFTKYTEGTAGSTAVASGKMTVTHIGVQNDIITRGSMSLSMPQIWVETTIKNTLIATTYDAAAVGIFKDGNNFICASLDKLNSTFRIQVKLAGTSNFYVSASKVWPAVNVAFKIGMSLIGNTICIYSDTGAGWVFFNSYVLTGIDLMTPANLSGFKPGVQFANGGSNSTWEVSSFTAGRFGAVAMRDQTLVTNEDGTPYFPTADHVLFTATCVDATGAGYTGVFNLDLVARTLVQTAAFMINRSSKIYGDVAAHIIRYANGDRRVLIGTWGNGIGGSIQTLHKLLTPADQPSGDILAGSNVLTLNAITLPQPGGSSGAYDAMTVYDAANSRWLVAYTIVTNTNFVGNPFYAAACWTTNWTTFTAIATDSANTGFEGTKITNFDGTYYITCGGKAGAPAITTRLFNASLSYLGSLNAVMHGGTLTQPHPMWFAWGTKQVMISFDDTKYSTASFTWGHLEIYDAERYYPITGGVEFVASSITTFGTPTTIDQTIPATAEVDNLLVAFVMTRSTITVIPSGWVLAEMVSWNLDATVQNLYIYTKKCVSGDIGAVASWTPAVNGQRNAIAIQAFRNNLAGTTPYLAGISWDYSTINSNRVTPYPTGYANGQLSVTCVHRVLGVSTWSSTFPGVRFTTPAFYATDNRMVVYQKSIGALVDGDSTVTSDTTGTSIAMTLRLVPQDVLWKRDFNDALTTNLTGYGTGVTVAVPVAVGTDYRLSIASTTINNAVRVSIDNSPTLSDLDVEFDAWTALSESPAGAPNGGLLYRTTNYSTNNDTFGYVVTISRTGVALGRGSNNPTGAFTSLAAFTWSKDVGEKCRVRVKAVGSNHKVWVNGVLRINFTDATYSTATKLGFNRYKGSAGSNDFFFDNIMQLQA